MKEQLSEENVRALVSYRLSRAKETRNREIIGSTYFVRGLPTQKLLAKYRRATVHYSK